MTPLGISHYTLTTALGAGRAAQDAALGAERSGLAQREFDTCRLPTWIGEVAGLDAPLLPPGFDDWDCRNNRLAELALQQDGFIEAVATARTRHGAMRIGVFIGTSTSGVLQTEHAYRERDAVSGRLPAWFRHRQTQNTFSIAEYVRLRLALDGVTIAISTACSSSAKVFASAQRAITTGLCDAAVVGGVDSLCLTTLYGFNALQLLSSEVCRPADLRRCGLSIGEAAGFALLERDDDHALLLEGYGESSDAWHMSSPDPEGLGARSAMSEALRRADLDAGAIDYINLHGTATPANDLAEDKAVSALFGNGTPCSSTKGWTGHTLGAAGIVEAGLTLLCAERGLMPRSLNTRELDPVLAAGIVLESRPATLRHVMSNSFGFGGSNCTLLFGRRA